MPKDSAFGAASEMHSTISWRSFQLLRGLGAAWGRLQTGMVAGVAVTTFWLAERLGAEPLLSCVIAGIITANRR